MGWGGILGLIEGIGVVILLCVWFVEVWVGLFWWVFGGFDGPSDFVVCVGLI